MTRGRRAGLDRLWLGYSQDARSPRPFYVHSANHSNIANQTSPHYAEALVAAAVSAGPTPGELENKAFTTQQRNHYGNAANGFVIAEEWAAGKQPGTMGSSQVQGHSRWFVAYKAKRVQIAAVYVRDARTNAVLNAVTTAKNSNGAPLVELATTWEPVTVPYCVEVVASVRWADDTLSPRVVYGSTVYEPR